MASPSFPPSSASPSMKRARYWCQLISVLCATLAVATATFAQPASLWAPEAGQTVVENFGPRDYQAHVQNWAIAQDTSGLMYFGNGNGLLEYDGVSWRLIETLGRTSVRSLARGPDGTIYVGAHGDFGYLAPDSSGTPGYVSLQPLIADEDAEFTEVWRIVSARDGMYFSARERLFRLSPGGELDAWEPSSLFALGFAFRDTFYTVVPGEGLLRMEGDKLVPAPAGEAFADDIVYFALPLRGGDVLLGARRQGLLRYDGAALRPFATEVSAQLQEDMLYHGAVLTGGTLALATRRGGLYLVSQTGELLRVLGEASGLRDEHLWYAYTDNEGSLWLARNTGLSRVEMPSPLSFFKKEAGVQGVVMDIIRHEGRLYAATSQGVYRLTASAGAAPRFEPVQVEEPGQCLTLLATEAGLLAGCEGGIYAVEGLSAREIDKRTTRLLYRSRRDSLRAYASTREGIVRLVLDGGSWQAGGTVEGLPSWALSIREDESGALWATTTADGVFHATSPDAGEVAAARYDTLSGLPPGWSYASPVGEDLLFHTLEGVYRYEETQSRFVPDTLLGARLPHPNGDVFRLAEGERGDVWFVNGDEVGLMRRQEDGTYAAKPSALRRLRHHSVITLYPEGSGRVWVGTGSGIYRLENAAAARTRHEVPVQIRRVATLEGDSLLYGGAGELAREAALLPTLSDVRFTFALPSYEADEAPQYQVRLDGFDQAWSGWTSRAEKEYTNLPPGAYVFRVRGRDADGGLRAEDTFRFRILPPWHQTWWARLVQALGLMGLVFALVYGGVRFRVRRLSARNARLEEEVAERTETLAGTNERLQRALDQNSEFMSIAAHDLKNPVTSILGFAEILLEEEVSEPETQEFLALIHASAQHVHAVLEELQDTEALETGQIRLHLARSNLSAVVEAALARHRAQAEAKQIRLHLEQEGLVHAVFDERYLPRILGNLISNAIKFSPRDANVWVRLRSERTSVVVEVVDEGPGLTAEDREQIFGKRARLSARPTGGESSSGLGLYIVRMLVELHGGRVYVESKPGRGATFGFVLPAERLPQRSTYEMSRAAMHR